jgi:uncharacterized protein (DUF983 family)
MTVEITCPYCGKKTLAGAFCDVCGNPIAEVVETTFLDRAVIWLIAMIGVGTVGTILFYSVKILVAMFKMLMSFL